MPNTPLRKIRMGMVGGGEGAFIGAVHRIAAAIDGQIELVCGCFSSDTERSARSGTSLYLPLHRIYSDYQQMMSAEAKLPEDQRMDFVAIVTPNHLHLPIALAALKSGFHVMSDKPATLDYTEAKILREAVATSDLLYGLSHTYMAYPMVQEARRRVMSGELGAIRRVVVEYHQGWLAEAQDDTNKQAAWRTDPSKAGASCCIGDIGVHAFNLAETIIDDQVSEICADLASVVDGRELDDDANILLRFTHGSRGVLMASQIAVGEENALSIRVYGEKAGLEWSQQEPNSLWLKYNDKPSQCVRTGWAGMNDAVQALTRTPAGHPEGYLEAFANLYLQFSECIRARQEGREVNAFAAHMPGINEALRGMAFIENAVAASASDVKWHLMTE